jgi:hypothetical protein
MALREQVRNGGGGGDGVASPCIVSMRIRVLVSWSMMWSREPQGHGVEVSLVSGDLVFPSAGSHSHTFALTANGQWKKHSPDLTHGMTDGVSSAVGMSLAAECILKAPLVPPHLRLHPLPPLWSPRTERRKTERGRESHGLAL